MLQEFNEMEKCFAYTPETADEWAAYIRYAAAHESFFVRYSAAAAIEKYGGEEHIPILTDILEREERDPVYSQPAGLKNTDAAAGDTQVGAIGFPDGTTEDEKNAWQRRGKLKQAACLAADAIYRKKRPAVRNERLMALLHRYAVDQGEDYSVRAAAAKTLRAAGFPESLPVLERAKRDPEFCTALEAEKSAAAIRSGARASAPVYARFEEAPLLNRQPFYIDDVGALRKKVQNSENRFLCCLWNRIRSGMKNGGYPWFEPFGALITRDGEDIRRARGCIMDYADSLEPLRYNPGVHFHSWCFAFPHARMSLYFQWLYTMNAFSEEEARELAARLVSHQFLYYHSCCRVKPEPETVDNQTLSLAISDALIGYLFGNAPFCSRIAQTMFEMSIRRVGDILEKMGEEGYSGEGSTYMNHVIASCIPLGTELLERIYKRDYFTSCRNTAEMLAREVMPDGFALPWDHYGYILPTLQCLAYNSRRIDAGKYTRLIEQYTDPSFSVITGWGFDDLVWTLIWYTERGADKGAKAFEPWFMPDTAGCIVSEDMQLGLVQMFDDGEAERISRYHCNPNALILSAYGVPLLTEGYPSADCGRFRFEETAKTFGFMSIEPVTVNDGYGCAGAHSVIVVDGYEAMRPVDDSAQLAESGFDRENNVLYADVTPVYKQSFADARLVKRRSRMIENRFWVIEDTVRFEREHSFAMRLITRPEVRRDGDMLYLRTPEGVELMMAELDGGGETVVEAVKGYPNTLDGESVIIDNRKRGKEVRWTHVLFPRDCKRLIEDISAGWQAVTDADASFSLERACAELDKNACTVPITLPVWFFQDAPAAGKLWYRRTVKNPGGAFLLRLPRNLHKASVWINQQEYRVPERGLLESYIRIGAQSGSRIGIVLCTEVGRAQYKDEYNGGGFFGRAALYREQPHERMKLVRDGANGVIIEVCGEKYNLSADVPRL